MRVQFCLCFSLMFSFWAWVFARVNSSCRFWMASFRSFWVSIFTSVRSFCIRCFIMLLRVIFTNSDPIL